MIWPWTEIKMLRSLVRDQDCRINKLCLGLSNAAMKLVDNEKEISALKKRIAELGGVDG